MNQHFKAQPDLRSASTQYPVEIIVKRDAQTDSKRAGDVAADLINQDNGIDLMLASSTPDSSNPVADQCEANGIPCITTVAPWQPWFFGRGGKPGQTFTVDLPLLLGPRGRRGGLRRHVGPGAHQQEGRRAVAERPGRARPGATPPPASRPRSGSAATRSSIPGNYPNGTQDFSAQIAAFQDGNAEILLGVPIPPDFTTFWQQATQQGYQPKIATIGKALLFPSSVEALGPLGREPGHRGLVVPQPPVHVLADRPDRRRAGRRVRGHDQGKQWTQPIGFAHALFEVAAKAFTRSRPIDDKQGLATRRSRR